MEHLYEEIVGAFLSRNEPRKLQFKVFTLEHAFRRWKWDTKIKTAPVAESRTFIWNCFCYSPSLHCRAPWVLGKRDPRLVFNNAFNVAYEIFPREGPLHIIAGLAAGNTVLGIVALIAV